MILLVFLLLGITFVAALAFARARPQSGFSTRLSPEWLMLAIAFLACAAAFTVVVFFSTWRGDTEIAWVGVRGRQAGEPLQIGGTGDTAAAAWPNQSAAPVVRMAADGEYRIGRGGGFIRAAGGEYLNGEMLGLSQPVEVGGLRVRYERWWYFWRKATVERPSGEQLASFRVGGGRRDRVVEMPAVVQESVISLRAGSDPRLALELERWASGLRLLVPRDGDWCRILDRDRQYTGRVVLPASWTILWPSGSLPIVIRTAAGAVVADFLPPWRVTSPLPPRRADGQPTSITFTGRALPGDRAFVLPVGPAIGSFRADLPVADDRFTQCLEEGRTNPFAPPAAGSDPGWQAVTCTREVEAGPLVFRLATVRDLPRRGLLAATLMLPLLLLAWGLRLCLRRQRVDDRWIVSGLVCIAWLLLVFRWLLALRYAADPAHLDPLALRGVTMAAIALVLVPALMLATARIWRDQYLDLQSEGGGDAVARRLLVYATLIAVVCVAQTWIVRLLWPNTPASYSPVGTLGGLTWFALKVGLAWAAVALFVAVEYIVNDVVATRRPTRSMALIQKVSAVLTVFRQAVVGFEDLWNWVASRPPPPTAVRKRYAAMSGATGARVLWRTLGTWYLFGIVVLVGAGAAVWLAKLMFGTSKIVQEIAVPAALCWLPLCVLLGVRKVFAPGATPQLSLMRTLPVIVPLVLLAVFFFPIAIDDVGGIVATLSMFVPLSLLLLAGGRPFKVSLTPALTLAGALLLATVMYMQVQVVTGPFGIGQTAGARVLLWKNGASGAQDAMLWANLSRSGDAPLPLNFRRLSDAVQHASENRMIAHEGRWTGQGHGTAPTRLSQIRQDTLQYDSTYAFFVVGDAGVLGGICLLLLFGLPLVIVLVSARPLFDVGHGLAAVVSAGLWLAALAHAGMNLGLLPFTGRNLPLLSVNSPSDLVLWTVLLCAAVQGVLWRVSGHDQIWTDTQSMISSSRQGNAEPGRRFAIAAALLGAPPLLLLGWIAADNVSVARDTTLAAGFDWSRMLQNVNRMALNKELTFDRTTRQIKSAIDIPRDTVLGQEIALFNSLPDDEKFDGTFPHAPRDFSQRLRRVRTLADYDALMRYLRDHDERQTVRRRPSLFEIDAPDEFADADERLRYLNPEYRITANPAYNTRVSFRVGAGADDVPQVTLRGGAATSFLLRGHGIEIPFPIGKGPGDRAIVLARDGPRLKIISDTNPTASVVKVSLRVARKGRGTLQTFRLIRVESTEKGPVVRAEGIDLQLRAAKGASPRRLQLNIDTAVKDGDIVEVPAALAALDDDFRPSFAVERTSRGALIGPAWVRGRTVMAVSPDPLVPWTRTLAAALSLEWRRQGRAEAAARFGTLTLDPGLQAAAQALVAQKGRERHSTLLASRGPREALPPRVALSVIALPSGEVVALGGWPRMQSDRFWSRTGEGEVPGIDWAEDRAPKALRRRYAGDRNFDRLVMGSATKPLFAAAVLAIHRNLDRQLAVSGAHGEERSVFGIELEEPPWDVPYSSSLSGSPWADFQAYLARSDNRYHLRLGFLGLVEPDGRNAVPAQPGGGSGSAVESMDGGAREWGRFPQFPPDIEFSSRQPLRLRNLDHTPLADRLSKMFGIGIRGDDVLRRYSFWTGDEHDDVPVPDGPARPSRALFAAISPEPPQFGLQRLESARGFVSLLLGGDENMWANVDYAGAFATLVTGRPVVPHVTTGAKRVTTRVEFTDVARKLRPGLEAVVTHKAGTAHDGLAAVGAIPLLAELQAAGYRLYAKTGTLAQETAPSGASTSEKGPPSTSRLVLAIVKWKGSEVERGAVFSLVVERGQVGLATGWLGEFLVRNAAAIRAIL